MGAEKSGRVATASDRLLGLIGGGMVVAAIFVLLFGGARDSGAPQAGEAAPPAVVLSSPTSGAAVESPVPFVFRTPARLRPGPGGWQAGTLHLHAVANGAEVMPGAGDIEPLGEDRYRWLMPLPEGQHTVRLFWAGPDHRPLAGGGSEPVTLRVRQTTGL